MKRRVLRAVLIAVVSLLVSLVTFQACAVRTGTPGAAHPVRFDSFDVLSPAYTYRGNRGVLLLDKRNGNVWFFAKINSPEPGFQDPVLVTRLPLEKLEQKLNEIPR